uniref:citrate-binding protein-like n=1 Tax=Erigeron canadensis TaxID=72917 RepID=UPI001CB8DD7B|nr:citrate-binding protein-like [Erigeron canadensis]
MNSHTYIGLYFSLIFLFLYKAVGYESLNTTIGFASQPLDSSNFDIQKPYDVPVSSRYKFSNGVHKLWVMKSDKPHSKGSKTSPRTEIRIQGYDYSSGVWQFEAQGYVPRGTNGVCIMQIFGSKPPTATTTMLIVSNSNLNYYTNSGIILSNVYNKWFRLNVIHDVKGNTVKVYIDGVLKHQGPGRGGTSHYFKCGVYSGVGASDYMESRWKDIKIFKLIE